MRGTRLASTPIGRFITQVLDYLPKGQLLAEDVWRKRHRALIWLLWIHVVGIAIFGLVRGYSPEHMLLESGIVGVFAAMAGSGVGTRRFSSAMAALGLVMSSAVLVHLSGGTIEMHFHFFVMVGLMSLYQDWLPFLLAIGFVVVHHTIFGVLQPTSVFDHKSAIDHPLEWAIIHGSFVLAASAASIVAWKLNEEQALHDSLTGLANRKLFQDRVGHALARMQRRPEHLAILFVDLDGFKNVNDTLGHAAGDHVLTIMAERVRVCIRPGDTAARLGGDEFAILLEDIRGATEAEAVADRLLTALLVPFTVRGKDLTIGASIGIALNRHGDTTEDMLRNADVAMYTAKEGGRGHHALFEANMHVAVIDRLELERDLFKAAELNELVLDYQPMIALNTGRLAGVEALVRWNHPERGLLQPGQFIEAAEATGAIVPIGNWVLNEACTQARRWRDRLKGQPFTVSVNVSARQLFQADIVGTVREALASSGLEPNCLILELTESVMTEDTAATVGRLQALKGLGVQLAIDDFGTGYSSLSSLRHLPFDILKIDKLFIDGITGSPAESSFARAILKLARTLDLETVAEGVEQPAQVESLRELHCELGQGFHFARPLSIDGIDAILAVSTLAEQWSPLGTQNLQP
jgi:diguanylate cyclase (GGDEF)-like protein